MGSSKLNIDIHQHFVPEGFFDAVRKDPDTYGVRLEGQHFHLRSGLKFRWDDKQRDPKLRLADMDKGRVDAAVLSILPPFFAYGEPAEVGARLCSLVNDGLEQTISVGGGRLIAMGHVPLQDPAAAIAEMEKRRFPAVQIGSNVNGRNLDAPELLPFFQAAERLGTLVFVHPTPSGIIGADRLKDYYLRNFIGNVTDTSVAIASLIFGGVLDACPKLNICFAHGGGSAPYLWGRWAHGQTVRKEPNVRTTTPVMELTRRLYFDSLTHSPSALRYLIAEAAPGHVMLGSDYPADMGNEWQVEPIEKMGLPDEVTRSMLGGTAARLLRLG